MRRRHRRTSATPVGATAAPHAFAHPVSVLCARHANFTVFAAMPTVSIERALHPLRRRLALARLQGAPAPRSVLFVCTGNLYRSPFAARRFAAALPAEFASRIRVDSCGFARAGLPVPPAAIAIGLEYGVNLMDHHSCLFDRARFTEWDLIVVMERRHARILSSILRGSTVASICLGDLDPSPCAQRSIPDPGGGSAAALRENYARVTRCVRVLATALAEREKLS